MTNSTLPIPTAPRLRSPRGGLFVGERYYCPGAYLPADARPSLEAVAAKAARASTTAEVVIGIHGYSYGVAALAIDPSIGTSAYLLMPHDRPTEAYHVHKAASGEVQCTCGDFVFRKAGTGEACKHGRRLAELGLITSTPPRVLPPFALRPTPAALPPPWFAPTPGLSGAYRPTPAEEAEAAGLLAEGGAQ